MTAWLFSLVTDHWDLLAALVPGLGGIVAAVKGSWRLALAGVVVAAVLVVVIWISILRADVRAAEAEAAMADQRRAAVAASYAALQADQAAAQSALAATEAARQKAETDAESLRRKISAAPRTRACADSPAIRGLLDDLRTGTAGGHP